jgi:DNA-binding response OmpR family regulator
MSVSGNKAMNYLLETIFKKEYELVTVKDVFEAAYKLKTNNEIEVVIVDVDFQAKQSWELIQHIKTSKLFQLPVVVLATAKSEEIEKNCYEFNIDEIFFKPFNPMDLIAAVKSTVSNVSFANA